MTNKLWGGRFKKRTDPDFECFSSSFRWDRRLLPYDLKINAAHVKALRKCGVLTAVEAAKLLSALGRLEAARRNGTLKLDENSEDVHSALQAQMSRLAGPVADKLHTGRSRNDLVSQSARLYCKAHGEVILSRVRALQKAMVAKAEEYQEVLVPGMTHLQNAQVVSQGHIFLAYAEMLERAVARWEGGRQFFDVCVLGSGALAGVTQKLDQAFLARQLGLSAVTRNSYDVSGDRDFVLNMASCILLTGLELSRIAEDLLLAQLRGSKLIEIDERFCTGSSMMPQKKNADFLELTRGAAGIFAANFTGIVVMLKGLPTAYNRDLQWDKKHLFDSVETCERLLEIFTRVFQTLRVSPKEAERLLRDESLYATDLADMLVKKGVPFAAAHDQVGRIVGFAEEKGVPVSKIGLDLLKKIAPKLDGSVYELFDAAHSVRMKKTAGSTHPDQVRRQIARWKKSLKNA